MAELEENVLKELEIAQGAAMQGEEGVEGRGIVRCWSINWMWLGKICLC
jgi:hypothetical protein